MPSRPQTAAETRQAFLDFFREKGHAIVPSAPLVPHDDPTLLFTNAGMNQFKDVFLGTGSRPYSRAADTQKCLRVSGKHNDLEEVGLDTYHHTFFEMLGNWSFGDYFKREAIQWAWELLVERWDLDPGRLYATFHEGDERLGLAPDDEAEALWLALLPRDHVLPGDSKDNFWMMGDTGPCGPCSEIHYDLREDRSETDGAALVNTGHPQVIEIWNLVFIQYNALPDGSLDPLKAKHVDTGMGFERLCAVLQGKRSNYDIDLFQSLLDAIHRLAPQQVPAYADADERQQVAMRVVADHVRTLAFAIGDGAQPGNTGRGYVIRRILRRAVRYGYQTLGFREPFLHRLVGPLGEIMGAAFPEIVQQRDYIERVIRAEEEGFLRTLEPGVAFFDKYAGYVKRGIDIKSRRPSLEDAPSAVEMQSSPAAKARYDQISRETEVTTAQYHRLIEQLRRDVRSDRDVMRILEVAFGDVQNPEIAVERAIMRGKVPGEVVFVLHDTYGFPADLTALMAREEGLGVDEARFEELMQEQRDRARAAGTFKRDQSQVDTWDPTSEARTREGWPIVFLGYDALEVDDARILKTRQVGEGEAARYEVVLDRTPFYAESGGQVGDTGALIVGDELIRVFDTVRDAEGTIVHVVEKLPEDRGAGVQGSVDAERRGHIVRHHTATHLLHAALREILGTHVQQKGSLVAPDRLRFDFSHFERVEPEALREIERRVNELVLRNIPKGEERAVPIEEARRRGAMMLFGEKYGDLVRVITFDPEVSVELCGGTHVDATGEIGPFRFTSEGSVASGIRRVEAVAGTVALDFFERQLGELDRTRGLFRQVPGGLEEAVAALQDENRALQKALDDLRRQQAAAGLDAYLRDARDVDGLRLVTAAVEGADMDALRDLAEQARERMKERAVVVFGSADPAEGKAYLAAAVTDDLVQKVQAGKLVGALAKRVGGGGGGRPHLATAGGRQPEKLGEALAAAEEEVRALKG
jgi:alanyl-tRNA synthetase